LVDLISTKQNKLPSFIDRCSPFFSLYSHKQKFLKKPLSRIPIHTCTCECKISETGSHFRVSGFCWSTSSRVSSFSVSLFLDIHPHTHTHTHTQGSKVRRFSEILDRNPILTITFVTVHNPAFVFSFHLTSKIASPISHFSI
jgi:hypothetical protein